MGGVTKEDLLHEYEDLMALDAQEEVEERQLQERGLRLEGILYRLLELEGLRPRQAVRTYGEEIDLSFTHGHRHFLLEARWRKRSVAADIFAFRGKLEGKLTGTLGVFVNAGSALSDDAVLAVTWGREINCLIFDGNDVWCALQPDCSFRQVLDAKLEAAASQGSIYHIFKSNSDEEVVTP